MGSKHENSNSRYNNSSGVKRSSIVKTTNGSIGSQSVVESKLTAKVKVPSFKMVDGHEIPVVGLGTWKTDGGLVKSVVEEAIDIGYRHFDCAYLYGNEGEIGEAIASKIAQGVVKREDLFVTSKLWATWRDPEVVEEACLISLKDLKLDYLDLYLIHSPIAHTHSKTKFFPRVNGKISYSDLDYLDTWFAMEKLVTKGLVRSIGVSNFNSQQLERVWTHANIKPVVNQVECHPYLSQIQLSEYCKQKGVVFTAYSSLGSRDNPVTGVGVEVVLDDKIVQQLAEKYDRTPGQILLRYQIDRGHVILPKSSSPKRLLENISLFDFELRPEDVSRLNALNKNLRYLHFKEKGDHPKYYPFEGEDLGQILPDY